MKKLLIVFTLFFSYTSYTQESASNEYDGNYAFDRAKEFIIDSIIGSPGVKIKRIYIDGLPGEKYSELTSLYYNGSEKEGIVLGIFDRAINEVGYSYWKYIFLNFNREEAISFFKVVDGIKDRERSYLNDKNKENHVYFKMKDITFLLYLDSGYRMKVFYKGFISDWKGTSFERMRRKFEKRLSQAARGKIGENIP